MTTAGRESEADAGWRGVKREWVMIVFDIYWEKGWLGGCPWLVEYLVKLGQLSITCRVTGDRWLMGIALA